MKKLKMVLLSLLFIALPISVSALEDWEVYEKGTTQVKLEEVANLKENLNTKVDKLNTNDIYGQYLYRYRIDVVKTEMLEDSSKKATSETIKVEQEFKSYQEALDYYDSIKLDAPYYKGEANIETVKKEVIVNGEYMEMTCETEDCEAEILDLNGSLEENQLLDYQITPIKQIEYGDSVWIDYEEDGAVKLFDSEREAHVYVTQIDLIKEGWKYKDYTVESVSVPYSVTRTYKELVGKDIYEEESEAIDALNQFKGNYPNYSNVDIIKVEDPTENSYTDSIDTEVYQDRTAAEQRKEELTKENVIATVEEKVTKGDPIDLGVAMFDSYDDALEALEAYKKKGYIIDSYNIEEWVEGYTGKVLSAKKDDSSKSYTFDSEINYVLIKQGKIGTVAVWTPSPLSIAEQNTFKTTYREIISGIDGSTSGELNITFISGYQSFDLSNLGNGWAKEYIFSRNSDGTLSLSIPSGAVSHTVSGVLEEKNTRYILSGTMHTTVTEYYVSLKTLVKGYDYQVVGEAEVEEEITKYYLSLQYEEEIENTIGLLKYRYNTKMSEESYTLSYEKYSYETYELATINWQIERMLNGQGDGYPLPPFTGVEFHHYGIVLMNLLALMFLLKKKKA